MTYRTNQYQESADPFDQLPTAVDIAEAKEKKLAEWRRIGREIAMDPEVIRQLVADASRFLERTGRCSLDLAMRYKNRLPGSEPEHSVMLAGIAEELVARFQAKGYSTFYALVQNSEDSGALHVFVPGYDE